MMRVSQVAERLNCSIATVYHLVESKRLAHYRCPGVRVSEEQLAEYLESCRIGTTQPTPQRRQPLQLKHIRLS